MELNLENSNDAPVLAKKGTFPATVAKVIDKRKLVINRGKANGIREGQRMLVYSISDEEIIDPDTGQPLGYLELVKGTGEVIFIQENLSIIESDTLQKLPKTQFPVQATLSNLLDLPLPFDNPEVGDKVKPI